MSDKTRIVKIVKFSECLPCFLTSSFSSSSSFFFFFFLLLFLFVLVYTLCVMGLVTVDL